MAVKLIKVGNSYDTNVGNYEVDTETDKSNLDVSKIEWGSKLHVIETDKFYILNSQKIWQGTDYGGIL